jgi:predicted RNase H-like HicB family nuclease
VRRHYPANLYWSDEDGGFIATALDLPGCSAFGANQSKALAELEHAIDAWIEAAKAAGNPVPEPSRPTVDAQPSGKLLVRMPKALHANLIRAAKRESVSLNHYIVFLLTTATIHRTTERELHYAFWSPQSFIRVEPDAMTHITASARLLTHQVVSTAEEKSLGEVFAKGTIG